MSRDLVLHYSPTSSTLIGVQERIEDTFGYSFYQKDITLLDPTSQKALLSSSRALGGLMKMQVAQGQMPKPGEGSGA